MILHLRCVRKFRKKVEMAFSVKNEGLRFEIYKGYVFPEIIEIINVFISL